MTLLLMHPTSVTVPVALASCVSALSHLRASAGYKTTKLANPTRFGSTQMGMAETDLVAAIKTLGG